MTEVFTGQQALTTTQLGVLLSAFGARLSMSSTTAILLSPYKGASVGINGEVVVVPDAGFSRAQSDNRIDSIGADAGAALAINTLYYVYVSNSKATFSPLGVRCSTVAPTEVAGVKYLGTSGNALNWRFVGWVRTISNAGTPNFADSEGGGLTAGRLLVVNYYNRLRKCIGGQFMVCPGYNNDNANTAYAEVAAGQANFANFGNNIQSQFIANGEDDVEISLDYGATSSASVAHIGILCGFDVVLDAPVTATRVLGSKQYKRVLSVGYKTIDVQFAADAALTLTIEADAKQNGDSNDHPVTGYSASVMV